MLFVREYVILLGQVCPSRVNYVNARQSILHCDLLSPKVLLHSDWEVRSAFVREVVG